MTTETTNSNETIIKDNDWYWKQPNVELEESGVTDLTQHEFPDIVNIFNISENPNLTSLVGSPYEVNVYVGEGLGITSLEGVSKNIEGSCTFDGCVNLKSLAGVGGMIAYISSDDTGEITIPPCVESYIMGLLKIRGLTSVRIGHKGGDVDPEKLKKLEFAVNEFNKALQDKKNLEILAIQDILMDNDCDDLAGF